MDLRDMTLSEIATYITVKENEHNGNIPEPIKMQIEDAITSKAWAAARLLDRVKGIDPLKSGAHSTSMGTSNHRSFTYKVRKAIGYSYP